MRVRPTWRLASARPTGARRLLPAVLAAALLVSGAAAVRAAPAEGPLPRLRALAAAHGKVRVIAQLALEARPEGALRDGDERRAQRLRIARLRERALAGLGARGHRVLRRFHTLPFVALEASPAALEALAAQGLVASLWEDVAEAPTLPDTTPLVEATGAWAAGLEGTGQVVAVLDTGVDAAHPMLSGKLVGEACFSAGGDCPNGQTVDVAPGAAAPCSYASQDCGHGTSMAGIAVGAGSLLEGVARGAELLAVQIFSRFDGAAQCGSTSPCARSYLSDQVAALDHVASLAGTLEVAAVNLSLGGQVYSAPCDAFEPARKAAIDNLRSLGIPTVISSGNDAAANGLSTPACISSAVSVGATTKADAIYALSNSDTFLSLLAPGASVRTAAAGGGSVYVSGTSVAAPHVAGAWALLREHVPGLAVADALAALQATGLPITDPRNGLTHARIRALSAAASLQCLDGDDDGVCDGQDLCPGFDDALDFDGDGEPDGCDADDDDDGLPDGVETGTGVFVSPEDTGSDPLDPDSDGDGFGDGEEVEAGSDPNDPFSNLHAFPVPAAAPLAHALLALTLATLGATLGLRSRHPRKEADPQAGRRAASRRRAKGRQPERER